MRRKSSLSKASSYKGIGEFWDKQDLSEVWEKTREADSLVNLWLQEKLQEQKA
jgi:hypothetical protein